MIKKQEKKRKTLTKKWRDLRTKGTRTITRKHDWIISTITDVFLTRVHINFLSSDREKHLWRSKYFNQVSVCFYVTFVRRFLNFPVRVFPFFSYFFLCYPYFGTFLFTWSLIISRVRHAQLTYLTTSFAYSSGLAANQGIWETHNRNGCTRNRGAVVYFMEKYRIQFKN